MRQTSLIVLSLLALLAVFAGPAFPQGAGSATAGFPDGTNARRAEAGLRFVF